MLSARSLDRGFRCVSRCGGLWTKTVGGLAIAMLAGVLLATVPAAPPASADDRDEARAAALAAKQERIARRLEDARRRGDAGAVAREQRRAEKVAARQARVERRLDRIRSTAGSGPRERRDSLSDHVPGILPPGWSYGGLRKLAGRQRPVVLGPGGNRIVLDEASLRQIGGMSQDELDRLFRPSASPPPDPPPSVTPTGSLPEWLEDLENMELGIVAPYKVRGAPPGGHWSQIRQRPVARDGSGRCPTMTPC
jgi:hypothetical protein